MQALTSRSCHVMLVLHATCHCHQARIIKSNHRSTRGMAAINMAATLNVRVCMEIIAE